MSPCLSDGNDLMEKLILEIAQLRRAVQQYVYGPSSKTRVRIAKEIADAVANAETHPVAGVRQDFAEAAEWIDENFCKGETDASEPGRPSAD